MAMQVPRLRRRARRRGDSLACARCRRAVPGQDQARPPREETHMNERVRFPEFEMAARGRARRIALGLSIHDLAKRIGCSYNRAWSFENDGAATMRGVRLWAKALEMNPAELAFGPCACADAARAAE